MSTGTAYTPDKQAEIELHRKLVGAYRQRRACAGSRLFDDYWNAEMLHCLRPYAKDAALDCCCGDGVLLPALGEHYRRVVGLDISEEMLALARMRGVGPHCELVAGDAEQMPFAPDSFDAVTFRGAFHHLPHPEVCLAGVRRVLRPGGAAVFFEPNATPWLWRAIRRAYYRRSARFSQSHRQYRARELAALVTAAGLQPVLVTTRFFLAYPFAGLLDHLPWFGRFPFHTAITRLLLRLDRALTALPLVRRWGFALVLVAQKPASPS